MMKTVYFVRHAKSSWADPGLRDINRPLNKRGFRDAPFMGRLLKNLGAAPDLLISSPAKRAHTTARFFANELGYPEEDIRLEASIYEAYPEEIMHIIHHLPEAITSVLVFGHNPTWTSLANYYGEDYIDNVPTCGIFKVEAEVDSWSAFDKNTARLTAFHYPKQYID
jgi:phosphohistidine phosphatase